MLWDITKGSVSVMKYIIPLICLLMVGCNTTDQQRWASALQGMGNSPSGPYQPRKYYTHGGYQTQQEHQEYVDSINQPIPQKKTYEVQDRYGNPTGYYLEEQ